MIAPPHQGLVSEHGAVANATAKEPAEHTELGRQPRIQSSMMPMPISRERGEEGRTPPGGLELLPELGLGGHGRSITAAPARPRLAENDRAPPVHEDAVLGVGADRSREHEPLGVAPADGAMSATESRWVTRNRLLVR